MPEQMKAVQQMLVDYKCDICGSNVTGRSGRSAWISESPSWPHECSHCGKEYEFKQRYPYFRMGEPDYDNGQPIRLHEHESITVFEGIMNDVQQVADEHVKEILTGLSGLVKSMIEFHMGRVEFVPTARHPEESGYTPDEDAS